jgi:hypothetical protein
MDGALEPHTHTDLAGTVARVHQRHLVVATEAFSGYLDLLRHLGAQGGGGGSPGPEWAPPPSSTVARAAAALHSGPGGPGDHQESGAAAVAGEDEWTLDPFRSTWLWDHQPSHVIPVAPGFWSLDRMAAAALRTRPGSVVVGVDDLALDGWLVARRPVQLRTRATPQGEGRVEVTLEAWREARTAALSRFEPVARGVVLLADHYPAMPPAPEPPPAPAAALPDPYRGTFLGPSFQLVTDLRLAADGAHGTIDPQRSQLPHGVVGWDLLDAATHLGVPRARRAWFPDLGPVALPQRVVRLRLYGPPPRGGLLQAAMWVRPGAGGGRNTAVRVQITEASSGSVWATYDLGQITLSTPVHEEVNEAFFGRRSFVPGAGYAVSSQGATALAVRDVVAFDWLPGTLALVYGLDPTWGAGRLALHAALKDHVGQRLGVHPSEVIVPATLDRGVVLGVAWPVTCELRDGTALVRDAGKLQETP